MNANEPIRIDRVDVFPGRLRVRVQMAEGAPRFTDERIVSSVVEAYPTLPSHSCINSKGPTFGDVMASTSIPHLLEHLVIAEQVRAASDAPRGREATFVGTTEWTADGPDGGEAIIEVSFIDDLVAIRALTSSVEFLNGVLAISA